jgi:signal peptidase II
MRICLKIKYISLILLLLFIIDRLSKYLAFHKLLNQGVYLFKNFQFQLQLNNGIAFGLKLPQVVIFILTIILITFLFVFFLKSIKKERYLETSFLGLVIIGATSNLLDRIVYQGVVDFIQISIWPNFNLADAYISIGVFLFLMISIKKDSKGNL